MFKLLLEFGPIAVFFATYKQANIFVATGSMIIVTLLSLIISYLIDKRISMPLLLSGSILIISGSITLLSGDAMYIKMKPTLLYIIFASVLSFGVLQQKPFIKEILGHAFQMEDTNWLVLGKRFAIYFFMMAIINEIVWRNFSEAFWVDFKVFGAIPITMLFIALQIPFLKNHAKK
jgi:intracellular septation protein